MRKAIPLNILIFLQKLFRFTLIHAAKFSAKTVLMEKLLQNNSNSIDFEHSKLGKYFQSCPLNGEEIRNDENIFHLDPLNRIACIFS